MNPKFFYASHSNSSGGGGRKRNTQSLVLKGSELPQRSLGILAQGLLDGAIALVPTDTGYCFVGDPLSAETHRAFLRLRAAHPRNKPFSLIVPSIASIAEIAILNTPQYRVLKKLLPGPYTVVLEKNRKTPQSATGQKGSTVGVRIPAVPWIEALTAAFGRPLIATSVTDAEELILSDYYNESLSPDAWWTYGEEVLNLHGHEIAFFVDPGEPLPMRVSTIFDITQETPVMVRDGGWDLGQLTFDYVVADKE